MAEVTASFYKDHEDVAQLIYFTLFGKHAFLSAFHSRLRKQGFPYLLRGFLALCLHGYNT